MVAPVCCCGSSFFLSSYLILTYHPESIRLGYFDKDGYAPYPPFEDSFKYFYDFFMHKDSSSPNLKSCLIPLLNKEKNNFSSFRFIFPFPIFYYPFPYMKNFQFYKQYNSFFRKYISLRGLSFNHYFFEKSPFYDFEITVDNLDSFFSFFSDCLKKYLLECESSLANLFSSLIDEPIIDVRYCYSCFPRKLHSGFGGIREIDFPFSLSSFDYSHYFKPEDSNLYFLDQFPLIIEFNSNFFIKDS